MNWQEIKEKYPKAWSKLEDFWFYYAYDDGEWVGDGRISIRDLYDFFDEQGLQIEIITSHTKDGDTWFEFYVYNDFILVHCSMDEPDYIEPYKTRTRTEAEKQAFLKAFEILENKL